MTFEQWLIALGEALDDRFGWEPGDGAEYVAKCGEQSWREMFDDDYSPQDTADEEAHAAAG